MRSAFSGRAAAYEKKNDWQRAVQDRTMVVLLLGIELEILAEQAAADRDQVMVEAAGAYRDRSACFKVLGRLAAAQADSKYAERLEQDARKFAQEAAQKKAALGQIELINSWTESITIVIDGVSYRLAVAETKLIPKQPGPFRYELPSTGQISTGTVETGKTFRLQIR